MTPAAVPPLVSLILTAILAVIAWCNRRGRITTAFALFASGLALMSLISFLGLATDNPETIRFWARVMFLCSPVVLAAAVYHVLVLTGYINRLDTRVLGVKLVHYPWLFVGVAVVTQVLVQATDLVVLFDRFPSKLAIQINPISVGLGLAMVYLGAVMFMVLVRALRESTPGPERRFLRLNTLGMALLYVFGPVAAKICALQGGIDGRPSWFIGYTAAAVVFYVATLRHQFDRVDEMNRGLEAEVQARTDRLRQAQADLAQSERMATLGRLVAGVAHELNTPVGAIKSTNNTLSRQLHRLERSDQSPEAVHRTLVRMRAGHEVVDQGAQRVGEIVQRLTSFAGLDQSTERMVDLNNNVTETVRLVLAEERHLTIEQKLGQLPKTLCAPAQVNQVLQSVLTNAAEAVGREGTIRVSTTTDDGHVEVVIQDDGPGISPENRSRIFDPGFTTKGSGVGTGLGLAIVYRVMRAHGGTVEVSTPKDGGTAVALRFPLRTPVPVKQRPEWADSEQKQQPALAAQLVKVEP